jgi:hypothetical protein
MSAMVAEPMSPGRAERHGFEYYHHETLWLYAALQVMTGKCVSLTPTHSSWGDQVELCFAKIKRDVIARGV